MQRSVVSSLSILFLITLKLTDPVAATAAVAIAYSPLTIAAAGATPAAVQAKLDLAFSADSYAAFGTASYTMQLTTAQSKVPTRRMYQGPPTDSRATFSGCKFWPHTATTVDICECSGFVYDPTNLKLSISLSPPAVGTSSVFVQPGNCANAASGSTGVTCASNTPADAAGGCGAVAGNSGTSILFASNGAKTLFCVVLCLAGVFWMKQVDN